MKYELFLIKLGEKNDVKKLPNIIVYRGHNGVRSCIDCLQTDVSDKAVAHSFMNKITGKTILRKI